MAWRGSLSRSVIATARSSTIRTSPPLSRIRPPPLAAPRLQSRRLSFANPREEWKRWVMQGALTVIKRRSNNATLYLRSDRWINTHCARYIRGSYSWWKLCFCRRN